ncbi:hypothetical protein OG266_39275 [Streptomyces sp. NBC_00554]|uniref:hypothetical protein n=1 Tax=Streptomyces sp. NBC_00554 TaxID=2903661 RepID=UPI00352DDF2C|nr:hypothetical protein OG266_39275 [Streptomyces sp. NBC_00554]
MSPRPPARTAIRADWSAPRRCGREASATRHELGAPAELLTDYQLKVDLGEFLG